MMRNTGWAFQSHWGILLAACLLALSACNKGAGEGGAVYQMGEKVALGSMTFSVLESEWRTEIGEGLTAQAPKHRFLILRLAATNGGGAQQDIPFLNLENAKKETFPEVSDVKGLARWFGMIRLVNPAATEEGLLVFDVPPGPYLLRVVGRVNDEEISRLVEIPYSLSDRK
jgi:hypothetical protein